MRITEHLREGELEYELAKVEERRDPPVPVTVFLFDDWRPAELHGWSRNPNGAPGMWGLCVGVSEYASGFGAEFCLWRAAENVRQR